MPDQPQVPQDLNPPGAPLTPGNNTEPTPPDLSAVSQNPAPPTFGTVNPAPIEPPDPYGSVSPVGQTPVPPAAGLVPEQQPPAQSGEVSVPASPAVTTTESSVVTGSDGGSRRRLLMIVGAIVLVIVLFLVGSFVYSSLFNKEPEQTVTTTPTQEPTKAVSPTTKAAASPTPATNLPSDVPPYGDGTLTVVTGAKGQIRTEQRTADGADKVIDFYKTELAKNGWIVGATSKEGTAQKLTATKESKQIVVLATPDANQTIVGIVIVSSTGLGSTGLPKSVQASGSASPSASP